MLKWKVFAVEAITTNKNKRQTTRNLITTSLLLRELHNRTENQINNIQANNKALSDIQHRLDSLSSDKIIYMTPKDSIAKNNYLQRLIFLSKDLSETNKSLKNALDSIQTLEIKGNLFKYSLDSDIVKVDLLRKIENDSIFSRRVSLFNAEDIQEKSFMDVLDYSLNKGYLVFRFYVVNHIPTIELLFLCIFGISTFLYILKSKYKKANIYPEFKYPIAIFKHPLATATLITITLCQLFIPPPPFIFAAFMWVIASTALTIIICKTNTRQTLHIWLVYLVLILLIIVDNLILIQTVAETWGLIAIAATTTIYGFYRIYNSNKVFNTPTLWIIGIMLAFEIGGLFYIIYGNYNFGKVLVSAGITTIFVGYLSIYTHLLSSDIIKFSSFLKESDSDNNINKLVREDHRISKSIYILFFVVWTILINRNSYSFQNYIDPVLLAFSEEKKIGSFTYSYEGIIVFFLVLVVSVLISKIVSFLTDENKTRETEEKSNSLGSWILLVRIGIISLGFIFAFVSAGIPIDRLTVIIGALGVGIGFGLQTLVNNLVSGLIIAFEKPVNLDDIIEIGTETGKMKSIGIRSSVVTTWDGADIIIPNGDLLSKNLTNWTMGSSKRRYEIPANVAYGTNLKFAKSILREVMEQHPLILKNPEPMIWATHFNDSSIDFVIKYWVPHFNYGNDVKSDLIIAIDEAFKANNIVIPFPQRDIHVQTLATNTKEIKE